MSSTPSTSSNFQVILEAALAKYFRRTGKDLRNHSLASEIEACDSAESMLAIFRKQASAFDDFRNGDPKLIKCLRPFVSNLYAITSSPALSVVVSGVSLVSQVDFFSFMVFFLQIRCRVGFPSCITNFFCYQYPTVREYPPTLSPPTVLISRIPRCPTL